MGAAFTTSDDGGIAWSDLFLYADTDGDKVGGSGTSLVRLSGKSIGLAAMRRPDDNRRNTHLVFWRSEDSGETWEPPVRVTPLGIGTYAYQDVLLRTVSGRIILPGYVSLGQSTGPNDVKPAASGKLLNGQWVSTTAYFFDPHFSTSYV